MARVDTLQVNVWDAQFTADDKLTVTRFQIPATAQDTLAQWSSEKARRNDAQPTSIILRGLAEVAAWFAPEVAFVREDWDETLRRRRLSFFFMGARAADAELRQRMQMALQLWVNTLHGDRPAEARLQIAAGARDESGWSQLDVSCAVEAGSGACPTARQTLYWDALAGHAAERLAGRSLRFPSGESRMLIPCAAQTSAFEGLELIAFPPKRGNDKGLWSEVITIRTATYPERGGLHLLARPSIRNWGAVTRFASRQAPRRSLDIFMPADEASARPTRRHTSLAFQALPGPKGPDGTPAGVVGRWPHKDGERIFDLLRRLTSRSSLAPDELAAPVVDDDGLWVLPRLGTVHKDKFLPGGTGIAWPDRKAIGDSLNEALEEGGFARAAPLQRRRPARVKLPRTFDGPDETSARRAVLDALAANGAPPTLSLYVFHIREATPARVADLLAKLLGTPDQRNGGLLEWADGLTINVRSAAADVLSAELPAPELTAEETARHNESQQRSLRDMKAEEARDATEKRMGAHIRAARGEDAGLACGILEMPSGLRDRPRRDPFQFARRELARNDILPQPVLVDTGDTPERRRKGDATGRDPETTGDERYAMALRDCFRMLGALPTDLMPEALSPAALTIVQRNGEPVGLGFRQAQAIPLAARVRDGVLECAIPDDNGAPRWSPYARAALGILQGDYGKFGRAKKADNVARFEEFFAAVLEDVNRAGPALVIAEGETIRHKVHAFSNERLSFDRLELNGAASSPDALPNVRLVRVSPDPNRQPFYYHEADNKWPSGLFGWQEATRTFYALKTKPVSVSHQQSFASMTSRHGDEGSNVNVAQLSTDRVSPQLDELCVMFLQPDDDPLEIATMTHRLRGVHVQTRADTASPFPLHELRKLGGGITF